MKSPGCEDVMAGVGWKRNFAFIWMSQFLSLMGFAFALPFVPYYMQELGVTDPTELKMWVSLFAAAAPFSLAFCSPFWGALGDRFGRRLMLLRANFGAALFLSLMGMVHSAPLLVAVRLLQGILTGTMSAAQTFVAVHTPRERSGFAMGALSAAAFSGLMAGSATGGLVAERIGYRNSFFVAGAILVVAGLLVLFGTHERFERRVEAADAGAESNTRRGVLRALAPILALITLVSLARNFDGAFLPLLVQEINGGVAGAAKIAGTLFAVASLAGFCSGLVLGRLADRFEAGIVARAASLVAAAALLAHVVIGSFPPLFAARFCLAFCLAGIEPLVQAWMARHAPENNQGLAFGFASTAGSLGWMLGPLGGGVLAASQGLRAVYPGAAALCLAAGLLIPRVLKRP